MRISMEFADRMKRTLVPGLGLIAALVLPLSAMGQSRNDVRLLSPREEQRLNKEAREAYLLGVDALDRVDAMLAIKMFNTASQLDPDAVELHYLTARLAHLRGRRLYGEEAPGYYDIALQALDRVGKKIEEVRKERDLPEHVVIRYQTQVKQVESEKNALAARNELRMQVGLEFRRIYAMERFNLDAEGKPQPTPKPQPRRQPRQARPGGGGSGTLRGGGGGGSDNES